MTVDRVTYRLPVRLEQEKIYRTAEFPPSKYVIYCYNGRKSAVGKIATLAERQRCKTVTGWWSCNQADGSEWVSIGTSAH